MRMIRDPVWRGRMIRRCLRMRRAGTGNAALMSSLIWVAFIITLSTAAGLYLGATFHDGVLPAALQAFTSMFGG
jgi:hypothetical protein